MKEPCFHSDQKERAASPSNVWAFKCESCLGVEPKRKQDRANSVLWMSVCCEVLINTRRVHPPPWGRRGVKQQVMFFAEITEFQREAQRKSALTATKHKGHNSRHDRTTPCLISCSSVTIANNPPATEVLSPGCSAPRTMMPRWRGGCGTWVRGAVAL